MPKTRDDFVKELVAYVEGLAIMDRDELVPIDESLVGTGILDSFGIVEMLTYLESEYELTIPDDDLIRENLGSIERMASYLEKHQVAD